MPSSVSDQDADQIVVALWIDRSDHDLISYYLQGSLVVGEVFLLDCSLCLWGHQPNHAFESEVLKRGRSLGRRRNLAHFSPIANTTYITFPFTTPKHV